MIIKLTNKDSNFYNYMGKFFGSRIVQTETKDRIYDDNNKSWYIYVDPDDKACGFISVCDGVIKNIYSSNETYLKEIFKEILKTITIQPSIVTNLYKNLYQECGLKVSVLDNYKHFVMIRGDK
ncbi:MAG: hypothetical protein J6A04_07590 [Clostridia bacterium]|nr:hypothetical protein [Clostridia bacterium]